MKKKCQIAFRLYRFETPVFSKTVRGIDIQGFGSYSRQINKVKTRPRVVNTDVSKKEN